MKRFSATEAIALFAARNRGITGATINVRSGKTRLSGVIHEIANIH